MYIFVHPPCFAGTLRAGLFSNPSPRSCDACQGVEYLNKSFPVPTKNMSCVCHKPSELSFAESGLIFGLQVLLLLHLRGLLEPIPPLSTQFCARQSCLSPALPQVGIHARLWITPPPPSTIPYQSYDHKHEQRADNLCANQPGLSPALPHASTNSRVSMTPPPSSTTATI